MAQNLQDCDFKMTPFGQGFQSLSQPSKELHRLILDERFIHGGNPVLRWMFENVKLETGAAGNIKPTKKKSREKIDGVIGAIMALDGAIRREDAEIVGGLVTYNSYTGEWLRNGEPIVEKKAKKNWL